MNLRRMGEGAVLVEVADFAEAHALRRALLDAPLPGVRELIPGHSSLLIVADPLILDLDSVAASLHRPGTRRAGASPRTHCAL